MIRLTLWPHRSLTPRAFTWFIGGTACMLIMPILALLGKAAFWVMLPFLVGTIALIWGCLMHNHKKQVESEELVITNDRASLKHHVPGQSAKQWQANPYWIAVTLYATKGPVEQYLTLRGNNREVELGKCLSSQERETLFENLRDALPNARFQRC